MGQWVLISEDAYYPPLRSKLGDDFERAAGESSRFRGADPPEVFRPSVLNIEAVRFIKTQLRLETTDGFRRIENLNLSVNLSVAFSRVY